MNGARGAKGGRNDRKRALKIKLIYLKKLKKLNANKLLNKLKRIKILNFKIVDKYIKVKKVKSVEKIHPIFDSFIMLTSLVAVSVPEKSSKKEKVSSEKKLETVEENKIVKTYSNELKDLREDLRELALEEEIIEDDKEDKEEIEEVTDKTTILIEKLDNLDNKTDIEEARKLPKEDVALLVGTYITSFENKEKEEDIESSELYINIADKVEELKTIEEKIEKKVAKKVEEKKIDKKKLESMKEEYSHIEENNNDIDNYTKEVSSTIADYEVKINKTRDANNEALLKLRTSKKITGLLVTLIAGGLLLPIKPNTKKMLIGTALTILVLQNIFHNKKKQLVPEIIEYAKEINKEIKSIDATINRLNLTIGELDKLLVEIDSEFGEYSDTPEYRELIENILRIKASLKEKIYSLTTVKERSEDNLNKVKVK